MSAYSTSRHSIYEREIQKRETRLRIIENATEAFSRHGFRKISTLDIAKQTKVSHGTIFAHFKSREALLCAVIEDFNTKIVDRLNSLIQKDASLCDRVTLHVASLIDQEDFYRQLVVEAPSLLPKARSVYISLHSAIASIICGSDETAIGIATKDVFITWISILHYHLVNKDVLSPDKPILESKGKEITRLFMSLMGNLKKAEETK